MEVGSHEYRGFVVIIVQVSTCIQKVLVEGLISTRTKNSTTSLALRKDDRVIEELSFS